VQLFGDIQKPCAHAGLQTARNQIH